MRFCVDTNVLIYAANRNCAEHPAARAALDSWLRGSAPWCVSWGIVYEFLRVSTHARVFDRPLTAAQALSFIQVIITSSQVAVLVATARHQELLQQTIAEVGRPAGNLFHDLHTAVLMREHGVPEIRTVDADFKRFRFLKATNPLLG